MFTFMFVFVKMGMHLGSCRFDLVNSCQKVFCFSFPRFIYLLNQKLTDQYQYYFMRGSRKICQRGSNSDILFYEMRDDPNSTLVGGWWPSIECSLDGFVIFQGIRTVLLRTLHFCDFSGGVRTPCLPPLDPRMA